MLKIIKETLDQSIPTPYHSLLVKQLPHTLCSFDLYSSAIDIKGLDPNHIMKLVYFFYYSMEMDWGIFLNDASDFGMVLLPL